MVYALDRHGICRASTSSAGKMPSTKKSRKGSAQEGAVTITITTIASGSCCSASTTGSSEEVEPIASCMDTSVPELTTTSPGVHSAAPGAAECSATFCFLADFSASISAIFRLAGIKMDSDSREGLIDGL